MYFAFSFCTITTCASPSWCIIQKMTINVLYVLFILMQRDEYLSFPPFSSRPGQALSERLFYYIAVSLLPHETLCELEEAVEAGRALSPILQWHKHPNDYFSREAQSLYFNSLRTYWQELIDLSR